MISSSSVQALLPAMRARCAIAPAVHAVELGWLDAALAARLAPNWVAHWAATRVDLWHGVAAAAALLGDFNLQRLLQDEAATLTALIAASATPIAVDDVAAAVVRVAAQLAAYHRRAFATRDLCWAALTLAVQHDPAKRQEASAVAAAVVAHADAGSPAIPFNAATCATLLATVAQIETLPDTESAPQPAYDATAAAACSITIAQGYAMWRAALPAESHTAHALDALLQYRDVAEFPQSAAIVTQGLDVALLQAAQRDAVVEQLTDPAQGLTYGRAMALTAELPACSSPTLVEIWVATRGLVDSIETVWWDVLGMVALAPLAAATAHDAEPTDRTAAELVAAAQVAHGCFGHRDAWAAVLTAPPLQSALHRCFLQMNGEVVSPTARGDVAFAGTSAACKASVLRRLGELSPHPAAPSGWVDAAMWIAAMCADVLAVMPGHGVAQPMRAWGQPVAVADVVQMHVPTPPVRSLVLP